VPDALARDTAIPPQSVHLYLLLCSVANNKTGIARVTAPTLARWMGYAATGGPRKVRRWLAPLQAYGYVRLRQRGNQHGRANEYLVQRGALTLPVSRDRRGDGIPKATEHRPAVGLSSEMRPVMGRG
jgi:hypothetical protein